MNEILAEQLAVDFCCTGEMVKSRENVFTEYAKLEGRRIFKESECFLKVASVNGKILASGKQEIIRWLKEKFENANGAWFMEFGTLRSLDEKLREFGCHIDMAHPFYIAEKITPVDTKDYEIKMYFGEEIEQFRGDERFDEAFLFEDLPKDEIGIAAIQDGEILGMAGATSDSETMWQIGVNVMPQAEGKGIGTMLVTLLKNEILRRGKLPFYGTSMSHIASQKVAAGAGFTPAWAELCCEKCKTEEEEQ